MRKQNTLFAQIVNFINSQPIGSTFKVQDLYNKVDERSTSWKRGYNDLNYVTRWYCGRLRVRKVLAKYKRGTWTVLAHIPDFVTSNMIYSSWRVKNPIKWYAGMNTIESMTQPTIQNQNQNNNMQIVFTEEEKSMIERLDSLMPTDVQPGVEPANLKFVYTYNTGKIQKLSRHVAHHYLAGQTNSLIQALHDLSNLTGTPATVIAEGMLFDLESEEEEKQPKQSQLDKELDETVDRLEGLLKNIDHSSSPSSITKIIYKFINGKPYRVKVDAHYECKDDGAENKSLRRLLELAAGSSMPWTVLADDILEQIEFNDDYYPKSTAAAFAANADDSQMGKKTITIEDIRGREVYIERHTRNNFEKAIVEAFKIECGHNGAPQIVDIEVTFLKDDRKALFDTNDGFCFSKEEVQAKLNDYINSL